MLLLEEERLQPEIQAQIKEYDATINEEIGDSQDDNDVTDDFPDILI
jgi:hypothetical protein